jgi:hypothetical protein
VLILISGIVSFIVVLLILRFIYQNRSMTSKSYAIALENENSGNYQEALNNYKIALGEVKKTKRNRDLRIKILEKIKVLHTVIDYHKGI